MKYGKQFFIIFFLLIIAVVPIYADGNHPKGISTDGTLGNAGALDLPSRRSGGCRTAIAKLQIC